MESNPKVRDSTNFLKYYKNDILSPKYHDYHLAMSKMALEGIDDAHTKVLGFSKFSKDNVNCDANQKALDDMLGPRRKGILKYSELVKGYRESKGLSQGYEVVNDTAYLSFDGFAATLGKRLSEYTDSPNSYVNNDTIGFTYTALKDIATNHQEVKRVVFDLTCNTGGMIIALPFLLGLMKRDFHFSTYNYYVNDMCQRHYQMDLNGNGVYGEIEDIEFGIRFAGINFRYIRPNSKRIDIKWGNEIGDLNWLSNKWIKLELKTEERNGKPGGMGTNLNEVKFLQTTNSDHDCIIAKHKYIWKPRLTTSYYQLEEAMNKSGETGKWKPIVGRNQINFIPTKLDSKLKQSKIVNLKDKNLSLKPWEKLYNHKEDKNINWKPSINTWNKLENLNTKALDINGIQAKNAFKIFNKLNPRQKENLLIAWKDLKRETRAVALRKKDKIIRSVLDTRLIQIYPVQLKIQENARVELKNWLEKQSTPLQYGFVKNRSTMTLLEDLFENIN